MKRIQLTERQLARVINTIVTEGVTSQSVKGGKVKGKDPIKSLDIDAGSPNQGLGDTTGFQVPTGNPSGTSSSTNQGSVSIPNTGGANFAPATANVSDVKNFDKMYDLNISLKATPDFKGPNAQYIPGAGDEEANLQMKGNYGIDGVTLKTMGGDYDIKVGEKYMKDLKKGKIPKRSKIKHAELSPTRQKTKAKSKNINHVDGVTRGGVTFDTKFKPGAGADPFTIKTS